MKIQYARDDEGPHSCINQNKNIDNDLYCSSNEFPNHLALLTMISFSLYFFLRILTKIVQNFFGTHQACFCSVVVITCASHAQGPQFDPGQKHSKLINFRLYCSDKHVYLIRVRSVKIVLLSDEKVCFKQYSS